MFRCEHCVALWPGIPEAHTHPWHPEECQSNKGCAKHNPKRVFFCKHHGRNVSHNTADCNGPPRKRPQGGGRQQHRANRAQEDKGGARKMYQCEFHGKNTSHATKDCKKIKAILTAHKGMVGGIETAEGDGRTDAPSTPASATGGTALSEAQILARLGAEDAGNTGPLSSSHRARSKGG